MAQPDDNWPQWVIVAVTVWGAVWAVMKKFFESAVRQEVRGMHGENLKNFRQLMEVQRAQLTDLEVLKTRMKNVEDRLEGSGIYRRPM